MAKLNTMLEKLDFFKSISPTIWIPFIFVFLLYLANRIKEGFKIDKEIKLTEIEIESLKNPGKIVGTAEIYKYDASSFKDLEDSYRHKKKVLDVKLEYLKKLKKYRWFFIKKFE